LVQERIAGDVLSLARIQLDMLSLHAIETDLRKEARKVIGVFASEAKMKKIDSKITTIDTDPVRLGQVVTNLISNAIRFTATSGRSDAKTFRRLGWLC
jgi:signal transduction histidine kinase